MPSLSELPPKIAQTVQLQSTRFTQVRLYSKLVGYVDSQAVLITAPPMTGGLATFVEGDPLVCRAFGGKRAFAFHTRVLRVVSTPFPHILLAYPSNVETVVVRKATRVCLQRSGSLIKTTADGETTEAASITDVSLTGAGVESKSGLANVTESIDVLIAADTARNQTELRLKAIVKSLRTKEGGDASSTAHYGLEFVEPGADQSRALLEIIQKHLLDEI